MPRLRPHRGTMGFDGYQKTKPISPLTLWAKAINTHFTQLPPCQNWYYHTHWPISMETLAHSMDTLAHSMDTDCMQSWRGWRGSTAQGGVVSPEEDRYLSSSTSHFISGQDIAKVSIINVLWSSIRVARESEERIREYHRHGE